MALERRDLIIAGARALQLRDEIAAGVHEAQPHIAHQPFIAGGGEEIDAAGAHVHGYGADGVDRVHIDMSAIRVREIGHGFQIVLETIDRGDRRNCDQAGLVVHRRLQILHPDPVFARSDDDDLHPGALQLLVEVEGPEEVQRVGDDAPAPFGKPEGAHGHLLAGRRALNVGELTRLRVDEPRESLHHRSAFRPDGVVAFARHAARIQIGPHGAPCAAREGVDRTGIEVHALHVGELFARRERGRGRGWRLRVGRGRPGETCGERNPRGRPETGAAGQTRRRIVSTHGETSERDRRRSCNA